MNFFKNRTNVTVAVIIIIVLALGYYFSNSSKTSTNKSSNNSSKTQTSDNAKSATKSASTENTTATASYIVSMSPAKDASLTSAPTNVTMKFSKKIEGGSEIKVTSDKGADVVPSANVISADLMTLTAPVSISAKGTYTANYSVLYQGGTKAAGSYTFTLK